MRLNTWLSLGILLASPAWSQESPPSFDLNSESIKKIVRDTAAKVRFDPPAEAPPVKRAAPPARAVPSSNKFLTAVLDGLIDLGLDQLAEGRNIQWQVCEPGEGHAIARCTERDPSQ